MYWYNPKRGTSERVEAPSTDEQAIQMLAGKKDSAEFIEYSSMNSDNTCWTYYGPLGWPSGPMDEGLHRSPAGNNYSGANVQNQPEGGQRG